MVSKTIRAALAAAFASIAFGWPLERRDSGISVELAAVSETEVTATVTNTADEAISLLSYGTFMDDDLVQKVTVTQADSVVAFTGIMKNYLLSNIPEEAFTTLASGESYTTTINLPAVNAMADGGDFDVFSTGVLPYAAPNSTSLAGTISFTSNKISLSISSEVASSVKSLIVPKPKHKNKAKRTELENCSGSYSSALQTALDNCVDLSNDAATAATSGSSSKFSEYFKTTSSSTRSTVAARFSAVADEASTTDSGATTYSCTDDYDVCTTNVLAYTYPSLNHIANCDLYYSALPALTSECHEQDQATTSLHEFTHAPGVYSPGTDDYAYGYSDSISLSSSRAVLNADSYALYANAIYAGC